MKKVLALLKQPLTLARKLWAKEPARVTSVAVAAVVFACAKLGVVVPTESITHAVAFALPVLLGGEVIRSQVSPAASTTTPKA